MCLTVIQVAKRPRSVSLACGCMASRQAKSFIYKSQGDLFFFETEFEIWAVVIGRLAVLTKKMKKYTFCTTLRLQ